MYFYALWIATGAISLLAVYLLDQGLAQVTGFLWAMFSCIWWLEVQAQVSGRAVKRSLIGAGPILLGAGALLAMTGVYTAWPGLLVGSLTGAGYAYGMSRIDSAHRGTVTD